MVNDFINRTENLKRPDDMDKITREFFLVCESNRPLYEGLLCRGDYRNISRAITNNIMEKTWGIEDNYKRDDPYIQNIIMTFVSQSTIDIYRKWVADGRKIPLDKIIELTTDLICNGINGFENF